MRPGLDCKKEHHYAAAGSARSEDYCHGSAGSPAGVADESEVLGVVGAAGAGLAAVGAGANLVSAAAGIGARCAPQRFPGYDGHSY